MNSIKKLTNSIVLIGVIMMGINNVQAGIIVNYSDTDQKSQPCQQSSINKDEIKDWGIIVNFTGIIVNFTGIIVNFSDDIFGKSSTSTPTDCGIIVN